MAAFSAYMPFMAMVLVQASYAGMNIISKLAIESDMDPLVLVAYRQVFAAFAIAPLAYLLEWKTRPKITLAILFQTFLCSLTGATANQVFYFLGLKSSTATIACALTNTLPAMTFILAVIFRQESAKLKSKPGLSKVMGTIVCVSGAMLLSFYHGHIIGLSESKIHWTYAQRMGEASSSTKSSSFIGPLFVILSTLGWAFWFIIQARVGESFPAPYTSTTLMCLMASFECGIIAVIADHKVASWSLKDPTRLIASLYAGIMGSALAFFLSSWSIQQKGPLYVSVFSPLLLIIVAIASWALLEEKLYVGTAVGSVLIVAGLYLVLWGKNKETKDEKPAKATGMTNMTDQAKAYEKNDLELQLQGHSESNRDVME
ncbi:WAT1-related protein [Pyrus ussuriensis x Pyrus communis]|uniref:WAT1-related protein n=1 Tax=Pyrus ussuriensis x Pyrus communis TaxID=2448454 RepID=A0A5N5H624_9ROSA|nr:WAT1-related protein [Pyrus ussuriensis x Pyrus communis]